MLICKTKLMFYITIWSRQVYTSLRAWRLSRHRELAIEAYKIFPNRVLCEATRRRRNDPSWAVLGAEMNSSTTDATVEAPSASCNLKGLPEVTDDLLLCWGIGAAKARPIGPDCPVSFGTELAEILSANDHHLQKSRRVSDGVNELVA